MAFSSGARKQLDVSQAGMGDSFPSSPAKRIIKEETRKAKLSVRHEQNEKLRACSHIFYSVSGLGTKSLVSSDNDYLARRGYRDYPIPHPQP